MNQKFVSKCPVCEGRVQISKFTCTACDTMIDTQLTVPSLLTLPDDLMHFVLVFLRNRGNIREVEKELGISYPTVCKKLDRVNEILNNQKPRYTRLEILEKLERGEITAPQAVELLREI